MPLAMVTLQPLPASRGEPCTLNVRAVPLTSCVADALNVVLPHPMLVVGIASDDELNRLKKRTISSKGDRFWDSTIVYVIADCMLATGEAMPRRS